MSSTLSIGTDWAGLCLWLEAESVHTYEWFSSSLCHLEYLWVWGWSLANAIFSTAASILFFLLALTILPYCQKYTIVPHSTKCLKTPSHVHHCQLSYLCFINMDLWVSQKTFTLLTYEEFATDTCGFCTLMTAHESFKRYTVSTNPVSRCPRIHTLTVNAHTHNHSNGSC